MNKPLSQLKSPEETRIQTVYEKREGDPRYSYFNPGHLYMIQEQKRRMLGLLRRQGFSSLATKHILDIGCGTGYWLREFINWGAQPQNVMGVDLLVDRVAEARRISPEAVRIKCSNASKLEFPDASFDIVFQCVVFTSVLDPALRQQIAAEMLRVLKRDGLLLWYDYHIDNPTNPDVRGVKKQEIFKLFPGCHITLQRITLAPPLARRLVPYSLIACYLLERLKILNTFYLGAIRKG